MCLDRSVPERSGYFSGMKQSGAVDPVYLPAGQQAETAQFGECGVAVFIIAVYSVYRTAVGRQCIGKTIRCLLTEKAVTKEQINRLDCPGLDLLDQAVDFILKNPKRDQYFQVGLSGKKYKKDQRCHLDESKGRPVIALPAVFADIDFGTRGHHKSKKYPPTLDDAMSVIHGHGFDPTVVVHSGHGLQAYWVFKESW